MEAWQMSFDGYLDHQESWKNKSVSQWTKGEYAIVRARWIVAVDDAIKGGKPVPFEVMLEYRRMADR
jgi:hypothetical protein